MDKARFYIRAFCLAFALAGPVRAGAAVGDSLRATYMAEIGVREKTGHNDGARVEAYLRAVGLGKGYPWCAAFVAWTFKQCGVRTVNSAWGPSWFPERRVVYRRGQGKGYIPRAGDVFGIYFSSKRRIAHVGFIDGIKGNYFVTVEGNTNRKGSREGDGVYRKLRPRGTIYRVSRWIDND